MAKTNKKVIEEVVVNPTVEVVAGLPVVAVDDKGRKREVQMSMEQLETLGLKNKSQVIRYLAGENHSPSAIANFLGIRYQHVRNVLTTQLKRPEAAPTQPEAVAEPE